MKILMTNHALREIGGTETWTQTMAAEFVRRGHDVTVFTFIQGPMAKQMPCPVTTNACGKYDLVLVNHNTCLGMIQGRVAGPKVFTSHGPSHILERAAKGADHYVAVSEEVRAVHAAQGFQSRVIRNPVNTGKFRPGEKKPVVLIMCKNIDAARMVEAACGLNGITCQIAHYKERPLANVHSFMAESAVVVTTGRGVYEALACNCAVLVFDKRSGEFRADGWAGPENISDLVQFNCSGRATDQRWEVEDIAHALSEIPGDNAWGRGWVKGNHDVQRIAEEYLVYAKA